jgi:hypothetical protein
VQGLKPVYSIALLGTTEVVPCYKTLLTGFFIKLWSRVLLQDLLDGFFHQAKERAEVSSPARSFVFAAVLTYFLSVAPVVLPVTP